MENNEENNITKTMVDIYSKIRRKRRYRSKYKNFKYNIF